MTLFKDLGLIEPIQKALDAKGYTEPTPIQGKSIPIVLDKKDLLAVAQTGTGKTASFAIPILQMMQQRKLKERYDKKAKRKIKALILTPTRELAIQVAESFQEYGKNTFVRNVVIFGGVSQRRQEIALKNGTDILVATPGRLMDLMDQGIISLKDLEYFVLDEADRMLDMGFSKDVHKILKFVPEKRQSLFFSATMPPDIQKLAHEILTNPQKVEVTPPSTTAEKIAQAVYFCEKIDKRKLLLHVLRSEKIDHAIIFTRTKHGADKIAKFLSQNKNPAAAIHGDKSQGLRQKALREFKNRKINALVATDIAARGIDVDKLSHVINFEVPEDPESYVHRIGRSGRAGADGRAITLCDPGELTYFEAIERNIKKEIDIVSDHPLHPEDMEDFIARSNIKKKKPQRNRGPRSSRGPHRSQREFGTGSDRKYGFPKSNNSPKARQKPRSKN